MNKLLGITVKDIKYFINDNIKGLIWFFSLQEVYDFIVKNKLEAGTYKLYKVERIINADI